MPIYEYVCPSCESKFEMLRPLSQATEGATCPQCHQSAERVLSTFACFTTDESGLTSSLGDGACASCGATNCATCNIPAMS